jgi:hypothetical protein
VESLTEDTTRWLQHSRSCKVFHYFISGRPLLIGEWVLTIVRDVQYVIIYSPALQTVVRWDWDILEWLSEIQASHHLVALKYVSNYTNIIQLCCRPHYKVIIFPLKVFVLFAIATKHSGWCTILQWRGSAGVGVLCFARLVCLKHCNTWQFI